MKRNNDLDEVMSSLSKDKWKRVGVRKRAGVVAPLFHVYSKKSVGIGDFEDMKLLIDWCEDTGNSILQLLPMNEVGAVSCPYDSISSFALEPVYLYLSGLPGAEKKSFKEVIAKLKKKYPAGASHVDYCLRADKAHLVRDIFLDGDFSKSTAFKKFINENSYWIEDFAMFKALKDHNNGKAWYEWEDAYKNRDEEALDGFRDKHSLEIEFHMWVQWQLFAQLKYAKEYANGNGVLLKGDLPILVSKDSADVWSHPEYFKLGSLAGAPPDMYCAKGQRWGMPIYNWDAQAADSYHYLKEKYKYAENFYDILRIDHVVGIFRIWSIPADDPAENEGLNGSFDPSDEKVWEKHGKNLLSIILNSTRMLLCAEDLGIIPKCCPDMLDKFGIPGNDVQRWVKDWSKRHDFLDPEEYRALSVAMLSTHDTTNWAAWWENEAGTIDEALFIRKCGDRHIDYGYVKDKLFDIARSKHGRMRWLESVDSTDLFVSILGKKKEELADFIDMYENTFKEKEKLWKHLGLKGKMKEACDEQIAKAAFKITLDARSVFSIQLISDLFYMTGLLKGDPYQYRINIPGTVSDKNWSLTMPIALEDFLKHKVSGEIRAMTNSSGRSGA